MLDAALAREVRSLRMEVFSTPPFQLKTITLDSSSSGVTSSASYWSDSSPCPSTSTKPTLN
jgi:hypothetical protein